MPDRLRPVQTIAEVAEEVARRPGLLSVEVTTHPIALFVPKASKPVPFGEALVKAFGLSPCIARVLRHIRSMVEVGR
jgi:hypothetical protein